MDRIYKHALAAGVLALFVASTYYFTGIYLSLFSAIMLAYLLHPLVQGIYSVISIFPFQNKNLVWTMSTVLALSVFLCLFIFLIYTAAPIIYVQAVHLYNLLTNEAIYQQAATFFKLEQVFQGETFVYLKQIVEPNLHRLTETLASKLGLFVKDLANLSVSVISSFHNLLNIVLSFMISFHILREWHSWPNRFKKLENIRFFAPYYKRIAIFLTAFDFGIQNWIKGQVLVSVILSLYYTACFSFIQITAPIIVGVIFGSVSFLPFIGDVIAFSALAIAAAYSKATLIQISLSILTIFVGHTVSGNVLGPFLIGKHTKIHPIQIMFGFLLHSKILGFAGVVLNVPICVITNAFIKSIIYEDSKTEEPIYIDSQS